MDEKFVCEKCIDDEGLRLSVSKHREDEPCSYCGASPAALLENVIDDMRSAIATEYGDIEDNLDVNGGLPDHYDIEGVFQDVGFHAANDDLMDDIISAFGDRMFTLDQEKEFLYGVRLDAWRRFQELVKHERRYTFGSIAHENDPEMDDLLWSPRNLLDNVATTIYSNSLIVPVSHSLEMWRVQVHKAGDVLDIPKRFTSPPREYACYANRMSPAGVPMFYGADDFDTAVAEVVDPDAANDDKCASGIRFRPKTRFLILDLTNVPKRKSFFDPFDTAKRMALGFLSSFVHDLSKPIKKDGREHIEYVPSQVFTEYIRHELASEAGEPIMGIKYKSSKNGHGCYVIFVEQGACLPAVGFGKSAQVLEAIPNSLKTVSLNK